MKIGNLAQYIDHTLLKQDSTREEIVQLCNEAAKHSFKAVCVNPYWVSEAARWLAETEVQIATVIGFPLGATTTRTKVFETKEVIKHGATEIDMVLNVGALKSSQKTKVLEDIKEVVQAAMDKAIVKVIIETGLLTEQEKELACQLVKQAGAQYVKTSTGFGPGGATVEDIAFMREIVGKNLGIKASGGIRDRQTAEAMIKAGATRIGASDSLSIISEA